MKIKEVNLGAHAYNLLCNSGRSKAELANYLGVRRQNINRSVFDKKSLDTDTVRRLSEFFDYNLFSLFVEDDQNDYCKKEVKARIIIEMGAEKQEKTATFIFGDNKVELK